MSKLRRWMSVLLAVIFVSGAIYSLYKGIFELYITIVLGSGFIVLVFLSVVRQAFQDNWKPTTPQLILVFLTNTLILAIITWFSLHIFEKKSQTSTGIIPRIIRNYIWQKTLNPDPELPSPRIIGLSHDISPSDTVLVNRARQAIINRNAKIAQNEIFTLYEKYPEIPEIVNFNAFLKLALKDTSGAEAAFEVAAQLAGKYGQISDQVSYLLNLAGFVYFMRNDSQRGIMICDRILGINPSNEKAQILRKYFSQI